MIRVDWKKVDVIFNEALSHSPEKRDRYLNEACKGEPELLNEVRSLLNSHDVNDSFMESPILGADVSPLINGLHKEFIRDVDPTLGNVIDGKYRLEELLGRGGMGSVYRATHVGTGRTVAVKVMSEYLAGDEKFIAQFKTEARTIGRLHHPNVVNITDFGFTQTNGKTGAYLVMEHLKGETLADRLRKKRTLSFDETLNILTQISLAIDEAHSLGITHRDLKPANIWIEHDGNIKVLDFGLAGLHNHFIQNVDTTSLPDESIASTPPPYSVIDAETKILPSNQSPRVVGLIGDTEVLLLSKFGAIMGTPAYMSPEQCAGEQLDRSTDIYSLGTMTYEMLLGTTPYRGSTTELMAHHLKGSPPSLREKRWDLPAGVTDVIDSSLSLDRSFRPPTAGALVFQLKLNADGMERIHRPAKDFRKGNKYQLTKISLQIRPIFFALGIVVLIFSNVIFDRAPFPIYGLASIGALAIFTFIMMQGQNALSAAYTMFLERTHTTENAKVDSGAIFRLIKQRVLFGASLALYRTRKMVMEYLRILKDPFEFWISTELAQTVSYREGKGNEASCSRSQRLMRAISSFGWDSFYSDARFIALNICAGGAILVMLGARSGRTEGMGLFISAVSLIALAKVGTKNALEKAFLYLNACRAAGESVSDIQFTPVIIKRKRFRKIKLAFATLLTLGAVTAGTLVSTYLSNPPWFIQQARKAIHRIEDPRFYDRYPILTAPSTHHLVDALIYDDISEINRLILLGKGNEVDGMGRTPLMMAALSSPKSVDTLLDSGVNITGETQLGTAVHVAARYQWIHSRTYRSAETNGLGKILSRGDYANLKDKQGRTPLMVAGIEERNTEENEAIINTLLVAGARINEIDNYGWTPLMHAIKSNNAVMVAMLLEKGADISIISHNNMTAQKIADIQGNENISKILTLMSNPKALDEKGRTTIMWLADADLGSITTARLTATLIKAGVNVNAQDSTGKTALMWAFSGNDINYDMIRALLKHSADPSIKDKAGDSIFQYENYRREIRPDSDTHKMLQDALTSKR